MIIALPTEDGRNVIRRTFLAPLHSIRQYWKQSPTACWSSQDLDKKNDIYICILIYAQIIYMYITVQSEKLYMYNLSVYIQLIPICTSGWYK